MNPECILYSHRTERERGTERERDEEQCTHLTERHIKKIYI
jgi:hypothetical protein